MITPDIEKRIQSWLSGPYDPDTKQQIQEALKKDPKGLADAFYTDLSFGTGGLRGLMGVGPNRLNRYTIQTTTQGLADYLISQFGSPARCSVVIGYDSRLNSSLFAQVAAQVLAGNGIKALLLQQMRPTPYVSFAVRHRGCQAGIMITASHNPPEYNGYKVYWCDGGQVVPPHDVGIMHSIRPLSQVKSAPLDSPLIEPIGETLDTEYLSAIRPLQRAKALCHAHGKELSLVYTSLHGTGITLAPKALADWGFSHLQLVPKQVEPDGRFPTVKTPNPEDKDALKEGISLLLKTGADLLLANDPDADRIGCAALHKGQAVILNGNEMAALLAEHIAKTLKESGTLPKKGAFITTIVTTELLKEIARAYDITLIEVLTGFKYIGEKIHLWEGQKNAPTFLFGAEESYGYLAGTYCRDKDGIALCPLIAEMALLAKKKQHTLIDSLRALYQTYGVFKEGQLSLSFPPGQEGMAEMKKLMHRLRTTPPTTIAGQKVLPIQNHPSLPPADVLLYRLEAGGRLVIRPSGTEPKIKIYYGCSQKQFSHLDTAIHACEQNVSQTLAAIKQELMP